jgi:methylenetetrahydrofolate dehydrogenase (NADP+)/methenyltetrahydrofolate cyclohydrolase
MSAEIVNGREIAKKIRDKISREVESLKSKYGLVPNIITIKIGDDPSSNLYLRLRTNACKEVGINTNILDFKEDVSEDEVIDSIEKLNQDKTVHGIFVQFPVPDHISSDRLINSLSPKKDIEGLHPKNLGRTMLGDEFIIPITPLSVLTILDHTGIDLKGKDVLIVNHSNIVGKPLAVLLLNRNATVSICHVYSKDFKRYSKDADVLITAAGVENLIKKEHVKKGAIIIDVAIISKKDGICGDVDFEEVKKIAGKLTPVPGGVGPVTVACSLKNMLKTFRTCVEDMDE